MYIVFMSIVPLLICSPLYSLSPSLSHSSSPLISLSLSFRPFSAPPPSLLSLPPLPPSSPSLLSLLLGRFSLDPNRVLDVLMEACSCYHDDCEVFLALLRGYPCETTTFVNILGFKFQSNQV